MYIFVLQISFVNGLDVSWIPSDPDGPLPLSTRYRSALQLLCNQINSGQKLLPEIAAKKLVIQKMCLKLQESNSLTDNVFQNIPNLKQILLSCLVIGGGTYAWTQRRALYRFFRYKALTALSIRGGQVVGDTFNNSGGGGGGGGGNSGGDGAAGSSTTVLSASGKDPSVQLTQPKQTSRGPLVDMSAVREARMRHFAASSLPTT